MKIMKLNSILSLFILILATGTLPAQNTTFKLSDYKNPDYYYQQLDLNFGINSFSQTSRNDYTDNKASNYRLGSTLGATYQIQANSRKAQTELFMQLNGNYSTQGQKQKDINSNFETRQNVFRHEEGLLISGLKRFYSPMQNYVEINGYVSERLSGNSEKDKYFNQGLISSSSENRAKNFQNSLNASVFIGKGRIEQVQDARMALYLLEDVASLNRNKRPATDQEVTELAKLITQLKYKRFFDSRLRTIAEITAIDSFMQQKGLVRIPDAAYFTSLNDNWNFSNNPARSSGWRVYAGVQGLFGYNSLHTTSKLLVPSVNQTENTNTARSFSYNLVAGFDHEKPISRKWQQSASVQARFGMTNQLSKRIETNAADQNNYNGSTPAASLNATFGYGFYPNSRTWLTTDWYLSSQIAKEYTGTSRSDKKHSLNSFQAYTGPELHAYYYLSQKLRLSFNFTGYLNIYRGKQFAADPSGGYDLFTASTWNHQLDARLTYSLF